MSCRDRRSNTLRDLRKGRKEKGRGDIRGGYWGTVDITGREGGGGVVYLGDIFNLV